MARSKMLLLSASALSGLLAGPVAAQTTPDAGGAIAEVIVTAARREERLQDVPIAITALTGKTLERQGILGLQDLAGKSPGAQMTTDSDGSVRITIRGISSFSGSSSTVGIYLDDTPISSRDFQPALSTFDVERVEILRGPQGTLYGEASTSGTLRIITNKPDASGAAATLEATGTTIRHGDTGVSLNGMVNIPLVDDRLAVRLLGNWDDIGGWVDAPGLNEDDYNRVKRRGGRVSVRAAPTEDLTFTLTALRQSNEIAGSSESTEDLVSAHVFPSPWVIQDDFSFASATAQYDLGFADFTASAGYYHRNRVDRGDLSVPFILDILAAIGSPTSAAALQFRSIEESTTQEFRLVSKGESKLRWTAGAFLKQGKARQAEDGIAVINGAIVSEFDASFLGMGMAPLTSTRTHSERREYAFYGEADYAITDQLNVLAGLRYSHQTLDADAASQGIFSVLQGGPFSATNSGSQKANVWNPKFSVSYKPTGDIHVYATVARGFRAGGVNALGALAPGAPLTYDPDSAWSYELGAKTDWFDRRLMVEGAIYHIDWTDVQVLSSTPDGTAFFTDNFPEATSQGVEAHVVAQPLKGLTFEASATYTKAELSDGRLLPLVPELAWDASVEYRRAIGADVTAAARIGVTHTDKRAISLGGETVPGFEQVDGRMSLEKGGYQAALFVQNLFDSRARTYVDPFFTGQFRLIQPRTVGVTLRARY